MTAATVRNVPMSDILGANQKEYGGDGADIRAVIVKKLIFSGDDTSGPIYKGGLGLVGVYWPAQAGGETFSFNGGPLSTELNPIPGFTAEDMTEAGHKGYDDLAEAPWMELVPSDAITGTIYLMFT